MKAIIGKKIGMTTVFDKLGNAQAVTLIEAKPNSVVQIKTQEKDGYSAIQLGYGSLANTTYSQRKRLQKVGAKAGRYLAEFKVAEDKEMPNLGSDVAVDTFQIGDSVQVVGVSLGKGFAGTVKRHHFKIGPRSHGSRNMRQPGSIGSRYPQRVVAGKKMGGRMGGEQVTIKNLKVMDIFPEKHLLLISGSVPGKRGSRLLISAA